MATIEFQKMTWEQKAKWSSGQESCDKCKFNPRNQVQPINKLCPYIEVCSEAFVRGYIKGHKHTVREINQKNKLKK